MTSVEWNGQWKRLTNQFRLSAEADSKALSAEWYGQLRHYHVDGVEAGVTLLLREAKETFFPALGVLLEKISVRIKSMEKYDDKCERCGGNRWIEAAPFRANGQLVYTSVSRCPDCGVPAPSVKPDSRRTPLTATEYAQWLNGTIEQPVIVPVRMERAGKTGKPHGMATFTAPKEVA